MLGVIAGTVFFKSGLFERLQDYPDNTKYGTTYLKKGENVVFVPRHGLNNNIPPHKINHKSNIMAFKNLGVKKVIGINSSGSLSRELKPGTVLVPNDYINLFKPVTFFDSKIKHIVPGISESARDEIFKAAKAQGIKLKKNGTYLQTIGPRLETRAEVNALKQFADVVGMTLASEATLCRELDIEFGAICSVDNYTHGIAEKPLSHREIVEAAAENGKQIAKILKEMIGEIK